MFRWTLPVLLAIAAPLVAQDDPDLRGWYAYFGDHPFGSSKWSARLEGQYRRLDVIQKWQQLLLRPGVNYELNKQWMLSGGYAFVRTYTGVPNDEHRIWEQVQARYPVGRMSWSNRIRFENRFIGLRDPVSRDVRTQYENRLRLLHQIRVPLKGRSYFTAYEELFILVKPYVSVNLLDQNRVYGALGWRLGEHARLEAGYMHQAVWPRINAPVQSNHQLMLSVSSSLPFGPRQ